MSRGNSGEKQKQAVLTQDWLGQRQLKSADGGGGAKNIKNNMFCRRQYAAPYAVARPGLAGVEYHGCVRQQQARERWHRSSRLIVLGPRR